MRIALVSYSLGCGGAERVMTTLANALTDRQHRVTLFTLVDDAQPPFFPLSAEVSLTPLGVACPSPNLLAGLKNNLRRLHVLRAAVVKNDPDVVLSFLPQVNILAILSLRGTGIPVVVSERIVPLRRGADPIWRMLRNTVYPMADILVVQTSSTGRRFSRAIQAITRVIPNPVLPRDLPPKPRPDARTTNRTVLALGRLHPNKGFDLLIRAFHRLAHQHPHWNLTIVGEGPARPFLESLVVEFALEDRVRLPGVSRDVNRTFQEADLFVLSSRLEGFPNALCEAMASGLPVVAADCPSGPAEIIRHQTDGLLVPAENVEALASAMDRLMQDPEARHRLGARAVEIVDRFSLEKILRQWEDCFRDAIERQRSR